jgi:hypothetical protein
MFLPTVAAWLLCTLRGTLAFEQDDLKLAASALSPLLSKDAIVTFPWDARWNELQIRGSSPRVSPDYSVVVEVATESDVQTTVTLANRFNIPFLAVSGTHGWTKTLNKLPYGIQINMRRLNTTTLSRDGKTAVVGGGTLQYEITRSLFALGKYAGMLQSLQKAKTNKLIMFSVSYRPCRMCVGRWTIARRRSQFTPEPTRLFSRQPCLRTRSARQRQACRSLTNKEQRLVLGAARR